MRRSSGSDVSASDWSDVDTAGRPARFVAGLDRLRSEPFFVEQKGRVLAALDLRGDARVADVGCGTGEDTAEMARAGCAAVGIERSSVMLDEARRRHPGVRFVVGDAGRLPFPASSLDRVRVDRVLQHLPRAAEAVREWHRVLRPRGAVVIFEPDLTTACIEGVDVEAAASVVAWRAKTRPGAHAVQALAEVFERAGFLDVRVDSVVLDLDDLRRADRIMGLPDWGEAAGRAGALAPLPAARWRDDIAAAAASGMLRYRCSYLLGHARVG